MTGTRPVKLYITTSGFGVESLDNQDHWCCIIAASTNFIPKEYNTISPCYKYQLESITPCRECNLVGGLEVAYTELIRRMRAYEIKNIS